MDKSITLTEQHSYWRSAVFRTKVTLLITARGIKNIVNPPAALKQTVDYQSLPVIGESISRLWNPDDDDDNRILTAGKIQNLRIALKKINGIQIPAGTVFSFWQHIGNPNIGKGYVKGREIREGCIVPMKAGGLCQLSNALYDTALKAGCTIIERHRHTRIIKGSLAEKNRDATVKWNYLDLRFKTDCDITIEAVLTSEDLIIRFRSLEPGKNTPNPEFYSKPSKLNDCYSCGNVACAQHPGEKNISRTALHTTYILDEPWNEYQQYIADQGNDKDVFIVPMSASRFIRNNRYRWHLQQNKNTISLTPAALYRSLMMRIKSNSNPFEQSLRYDKILAEQAAKKIPVTTEHLVISQNLLPFLYEYGALGGRTYDVLMTRMPAEQLHRQLDIAHQTLINSPTLNDFRATEQFIKDENHSLTAARHIITPHRGIAKIFNHKTVLLNWHTPTVAKATPSLSKRILFPASALGRKGVYEVKALADALDLTVVVSGSAIEYPGFWGHTSVEQHTGNNFNNIAAVVYPAYVEHKPAMLLKALAAGVPVIASSACGLSDHSLLTTVQSGDIKGLIAAVQKVIEPLQYRENITEINEV